VLVCSVDAGDEFFVVRRLETRRVPAGRIDPHGFITHDPEDAFIGACRVAEHRDFALQPKIVELLKKAHRSVAGKSHIDGVKVWFDLRQIGRVFGRVEWRPEFLHDLVARRLECEMKAAGALVAVSEIFGDDGDLLIAEALGRVIAEWIGHLRCRNRKRAAPTGLGRGF
jgi:hypothetical protein